MMRRSAFALAAFGLITSTAFAAAAQPTAADLLAGSRWGWLGATGTPESSLPAEIEGARRAACSAPNLSFRRAGDQLVRFEHAATPPGVTIYAKSRTTPTQEGVLIEGFVKADSAAPLATMTLLRGDQMLKVKAGMFGDRFYVRCPQPGALMYDPPRQQPNEPGTRRRP